MAIVNPSAVGGANIGSLLRELSREEEESLLARKPSAEVTSPIRALVRSSLLMPSPPGARVVKVTPEPVSPQPSQPPAGVVSSVLPTVSPVKATMPTSTGATAPSVAPRETAPSVKPGGETTSSITPRETTTTVRPSMGNLAAKGVDVMGGTFVGKERGTFEGRPIQRPSVKTIPAPATLGKRLISLIPTLGKMLFAPRQPAQTQFIGLRPGISPLDVTINRLLGQQGIRRTTAQTLFPNLFVGREV